MCKSYSAKEWSCANDEKKDKASSYPLTVCGVKGANLDFSCTYSGLFEKYWEVFLKR